MADWIDTHWILLTLLWIIVPFILVMIRVKINEEYIAVYDLPKILFVSLGGPITTLVVLLIMVMRLCNRFFPPAWWYRVRNKRVW